MPGQAGGAASSDPVAIEKYPILYRARSKLLISDNDRRPATPSAAARALFRDDALEIRGLADQLQTGFQ